MKKQAIKYLESLVNDDTPKKELDLLRFIKKCVNNYESGENVAKVDWESMFETLWKMYPRKVNKCLAKKTFEHKVRGLNEEECKARCNLIYKAQKIETTKWEEQRTEIRYIPHYSSWLNNSVPNSPKYKGR